MRVLLHTFGCKANQYDTEVVRQRLERAGCEVVDDPALADAAVVNSCTVTHVGESKMRGFVRRLARQRPEIRTVVMGCAAALDNGTIAGLPGVAAVVGGSDAGEVARALGLDAGTAEPLAGFSGSSRAWLKVQDGCDEHCTFCATTLARGDNRSLDPERLVTEARALALRHAEIVLTGVHIGTYGRDGRDGGDGRDGRDGGDGGDGGDGWTLGRLAQLLIASVPDVRFRLSSVEATEVCADLERLMAEQPDRLAPHLHAPLQSGSDRVLRRMGRHWYTAATYRERLEEIARRVAPFGLGADVIVGFPGESDADHRETAALIESLPFTYLHVFPYSPRNGTAAPRLGPPTAPDIVRERSAELRAIAARKAAAHRAGRAGQTADVVLETRQAGIREGLTEDYLGVQLPADAVAGQSRVTARLELDGARLVGTPMVPAAA
jgi:threonylcarbamoyladenosine tRNA methylthiotransferase MtaB